MISAALVALLLSQASDDRPGGAPTGTYVAGGTDVALADGGTNKSITAVAGALVWVDANSFELTSAGASGQLLISNGTSAPSWLTLVPIANGGTNKALTLSAGGIIWTDADSFEVLAGTATANALLVSGNAATPAWVTGLTASGTTLTGATTLNLSSTTVNLQAGATTLFQCFSGTCRLQNGTAFSTNSGRFTTASGIMDSGTVGTVTVNGATTFVVTQNVMKLDCDGAETITTITGASLLGTLVTIIMTDAECTFTDTNDGGANTIDLAGGDVVSADDKVLQIVYDGTLWRGVSVSAN